MAQDFERVSVPAAGSAVTYDDDGFTATETPVVPFSPGVAPALVSAARRILDAAAERMGRELHWMRVYTGQAARERYGEPFPAETVRAFRQFRLGVLGPLSENRGEAITLGRELHRRLEMTVAATRCSPLARRHPATTGDVLDVTLFRDVSEDVAAGLEYGPETAAASALREQLLEYEGSERLPDEPAGYSVSPISQHATETLVDAALEYAFEHDHQTVTISHQGDQRPASEGSFLQWAREYLQTTYGDSIVPEQTFREEYETFPEDELVLFERRTDQLCRELLVSPGEYDTVLAPALGGTYLSTVAETAVGQVGESAALSLGDGTLLATARPATRTQSLSPDSSPVPLVLAGCLLFDYLGWADAASAVRAAVAETVPDSEPPRPLCRRQPHDESVPPSAFADDVVDRIESPHPESGSGGVVTSAEERAAIRESIATLYNVVFEDSLRPGEIELNQLLAEDEEADVYLPEIGINFYHWRRWSAERRLEVLLHELAHVEEEPGERDHGDEFYERFVELTEIAADWTEELEAAFDEEIAFDRVRRFILDSVHEETIEADQDDVEERKRWLRARLWPDDYDVE